MLMFGREVNMPTDLLYPFPKPEIPPTVSDYVMSLRDQLDDCYFIAHESLRDTAERQKRNHDTRVVERQYEPGTLVYKLLGPGKKLDNKYAGPFLVTEKLSPSIYKIQGKKNTEVIHHDRLKPFLGTPPKWVDSLKKDIVN